MREWLSSWSTDQMLMAGAALGGVLLLVLVLWFTLGPGPQRRRRLRYVQRLVDQGDWHAGLEHLQQMRAGPHVNDAWQTRLNDLEGQALLKGAAERLAEQDYETALNYGLHAARLLGRSPLEARAQVQNALLEEVRRGFSPAAWTDTPTLLALIERTLRVQSPCREASFWEALCHLRDGNIEAAQDHLQRARTGMDRPPDDEAAEGRTAPPAPPSPILDPSLYLGAILLRQGKAKESLRFFTEANRLDPNCALVPLHLGCAILGAGGDVGLAVRTLQKALGPKGLGAWQEQRERFWAEVYPENRSYVRKLAAKYPFQCPLWGDGPTHLIRQGQLALAQGLQRIGQDAEAAALFDQVLKAGAPSQAVLRGLGLTLAKLGRFDDAYKPLRLAYDQENPKERLTAGYLALCSVKAKPATAEDREKNLTWAVRAVTPFSAPGDTEWAGLLGAIFAEARQANVPLSLDDQLYLCEHLASVHAADAQAAAAFAQIRREHPAAFRHEYAWLYTQAVTEHGGPEDLSLFEMTLADRDAARAYYVEQGWEFEEVERAYLERVARGRPGQLPPVFGPEPLSHIEPLLLGAAARAEAAGDLDAALGSIETFVRLVPDRPTALDRLAALQHRAGRTDAAIAILEDWRQKRPDDPLPLIRLALLQARPGMIADSLALLRQASALAQGPAQPRIAWLAAQLALHHWARPWEGEPPPAPDDALLTAAEEFLTRAVDGASNSDAALASLVAIRWLRGDLPGVAALAPRCAGLAKAEPPHRFFLALALAAAGDWAAVAEACRTIAGGDDSFARRLGSEAAYLEGRARAELRDAARAIDVLQRPATTEETPSAAHAQALLGHLLFREGHYDAAAAWWQRLPTARRRAWKIADVLGGAQMLGALQAFDAGQYEAAADKLRLAGRLGCRDRRLGGMLLQALFRAGRQAAAAAARETA